jgi:hypothetical protein
MPRKKRACRDCGKLSYGNRCMAHSNPAARFNRWGHDHRKAQRERPVVKLDSWWLEADFYGRAKAEAERMALGPSTNYRSKESE